MVEEQIKQHSFLLNFCKFFSSIFFSSLLCMPVFENEDLLKLRESEMVFVNKEMWFSSCQMQASSKQRRWSGRDLALVKEEKWLTINSERAAWAGQASAPQGFVYMQMTFSKALENTSFPQGGKHPLGTLSWYLVYSIQFGSFFPFSPLIFLKKLSTWAPITNDHKFQINPFSLVKYCPTRVVLAA